MAANIYISKLDLDQEQRSQIQHICTTEDIHDCTFFVDNKSQQISAAALLAANQLDFDVHESLASR